MLSFSTLATDVRMGLVLPKCLELDDLKSGVHTFERTIGVATVYCSPAISCFPLCDRFFFWFEEHPSRLVPEIIYWHRCILFCAPLCFFTEGFLHCLAIGCFYRSSHRRTEGPLRSIRRGRRGLWRWPCWTAVSERWYPSAVVDGVQALQRRSALARVDQDYAYFCRSKTSWEQHRLHRCCIGVHSSQCSACTERYYLFASYDTYVIASDTAVALQDCIDVRELTWLALKDCCSAPWKPASIRRTTCRS